MSKYIAKQVAPERQESPLFLEDEFFPDFISVFGNNDLVERFSPEIAPIMKTLRDSWFEYQMECYKESVDDERHVLQEWFDNIEALNDEQVHRLASLIRGDTFRRDREDVLCGIFSILTGKQYDYQTIRGCVQRDWNYVFYVHDDVNDIEIHMFETEYFNTGEEWLVYDDEYDEYPCSCYTHWFDVKEKRNELAKCIGCKPEDIQMYEFSGWTYVPNYSEVVF